MIYFLYKYILASKLSSPQIIEINRKNLYGFSLKKVTLYTSLQVLL
jgi:hypothetical protein